jgi:predicted nucleic acid-binding protein
LRPDFVIDASVTLPWCFLDESSTFTDDLLDKLISVRTAVVPAHWPLEVLNAVIMGRRRGRVADDTIAKFFGSLRSVNIAVDGKRMLNNFETVSTLSEKYGLTCYDAAYLELAQRTNLPLATLDKDLRKAATTASVVLL